MRGGTGKSVVFPNTRSSAALYVRLIAAAKLHLINAVTSPPLNNNSI